MAISSTFFDRIAPQGWVWYCDSYP